MVQHADIDHTGITGTGTGSALACRVERHAALNLGAAADISWDSEIRDDGGFWSAGAPTRLTVPSTGWYVIGAAVWTTSTTSDLVQLFLVLNGTTSLAGAQNVQVATGRKIVTMETLAYLTAADYVVVNSFSDATTALDTGQPGAQNFWIAKIS